MSDDRFLEHAWGSDDPTEPDSMSEFLLIERATCICETRCCCEEDDDE